MSWPAILPILLAFLEALVSLCTSRVGSKEAAEESPRVVWPACG
jgi:hypothetical protein